MKPKIRCATTPNGDIEAAFIREHTIVRVILDPRTGNVTQSTAKEGTDEFRWLVTEARKHCFPCFPW